MTSPQTIHSDFVHANLDNGVELAIDRLPQRDTVALVIRMFAGLAEEPPELAGIGAIVEGTISKGTEHHSGRELADAFDALGAMQSSMAGRESMFVRLVCLPEFLLDGVRLAAEMFCRPTFPAEACEVAVELARKDLKSVEDDPGDVCRMMIQRLTLGPVLGRDPTGEFETLDRISPADVRDHWRRCYHSGRMQIAAAGPVDVDQLTACVEAEFADLGSPERAGRVSADFTFTPGRRHRHKDIKQQQIAITMPGVPRDHAEFGVEQVLLGVLSGGMSGRLFTEVREKQGLVYNIAAWNEQPRGAGVVHLGASSTPENCEKTFATMMREIERLSEDLTEVETERAKNSLISHALTHDDVTRARAASLSEDLFFYGKPIGLAPKIDRIRAVTTERIEDYAHRFDSKRTCVATLGPREFGDLG